LALARSSRSLSPAPLDPGGAGFRAHDVAARSVEACDQASSDRIGSHDEYNRRRRGCGFDCVPHPTARPNYNGHLPADEISRQSRQPIWLIVRPVILDGDVLALDESSVVETLPERIKDVFEPGSRRGGLRNPITGTVGCCARTERGHATAAPPSSATKTRRLMPGMGSLPGAAKLLYRDPAGRSSLCDRLATQPKIIRTQNIARLTSAATSAIPYRRERALVQRGIFAMEPSFRSRADVARPGSLRWRSKMLLASSAAFILASVAPASAIVINDAPPPKSAWSVSRRY
jgi:hypothetical protein